MKLVILCVFVLILKKYALASEPKCSSFDYDDKLLTKMIRMEFEMRDVINKQNEFLEKLKLLSESIETFTTVQESKGTEMENKVIESLQQHNASFTKMQESLETELRGVTETAYKELDKIKDLAVKKDVVFHVKKIAVQPTADAVIKFQTVVTNIDGVYDLDSGYFTVPIPGTYWFTAQLCTTYEGYISPSIFVNGKLISKIYTSNKYNCNPVIAVAVLKSNDTVCVKAGSSLAKNPIWDGTENQKINSFMGSLVK